MTSPKLEHAVLYATIQGVINTTQLKPYLKSFSHTGKKIYQAIQWLHDNNQLPPYPTQSVSLTCTDVFGHDSSDISSYLTEVMAQPVGAEITTVIEGSLNKFKLLQLSQLVIDQMGKNTFDETKFLEVLQESSKVAEEIPTLWEESQSWGDINDDTTRIAIGDRFPLINQEAGGLKGLWVIGGTTGVGKSTLAWQLALITAAKRRVFYYDMENTAQVLFSRTQTAFRGDLDKVREALSRISIRRDPRTLVRDIRTLTEPGLIVVDSLQKLPSDVHVKRETMEGWLATLDRFKQDGHIIIVLSQLNRGEGSYKGTNDIEHTADFGIKLDTDPDYPNTTDVYIEKNRHGKAHGHICQLYRENDWLFKEI